VWQKRKQSFSFDVGAVLRTAPTSRLFNKHDRNACNVLLFLRGQCYAPHPHQGFLTNVTETHSTFFFFCVGGAAHCTHIKAF
jgi:hypothetical protein